jgi:hypothetical protein
MTTYGSTGHPSQGTSSFFDESVPLETSSLKSHQAHSYSHGGNVPQQYEQQHMYQEEDGEGHKSSSFKSMLKKQMAEGIHCYLFYISFN